MQNCNDTQKKSEKQFHGEKILLVDDNAMNLKVMRLIFEDQGLVVDTAMNGKEAVQKFLRSPEYSYEIILLDINMYGMDGFKTAECIRKSKRTDSKKVKIYAVSANVGAEYRERAKKAGMNGYITKPLCYEEIFSLIRGIVKQNREETENVVKDLNLHFLFNALNSIKCAVILGEENAPDLIDDFSKYLRYVFSHYGQKELVHGGKNLDYVMAYNRLQEARFEKLKVEYGIETTRFLLPPFLLEEWIYFFIHEVISGKRCDGKLYLESQETQKGIQLSIGTRTGGMEETEWDKHTGKTGFLERMKTMLENLGISMKAENDMQRGVWVQLLLPATEMNIGEGN